MELPVSNIINVSITNTPSGLTEKNVNSLMLFTHETPDSLNSYDIFISPSQVAEVYGTSSVTYQMANAIFAQSPNLRTGDGRLVIAPLEGAVSATQGDFTTADIDANLADIILVTDGDLRVTIDSVNYDLTSLNFTAATDWDDVAALLDARLSNGIVTATANGIKITSKKVGDDSDVTIAAVPAGTGTAMEGAGYFNAAGGTATSGADSSGETLVDAIARVGGSVGFVPFITTLEIEDDVLVTTSNAVQAMDKIFLHHFVSTADIAGVITTVQNAANTKTRCLLYTESPAKANLFKAAYAGRAFSVNFQGSLTSQTMNLKQLATITQDNGITQTLFEQAKTAGADLYVSFEGVVSVVSNGGNDFFDNVYNDLALKFALEAGGFNFLRQTNTKVPQTEQGMNGLKTAYATVLERFVKAGVIAAGSWTSSERFGDPEIFDEAVLEAGYYVYSEPITQQAASEREAREAPLVQIAVKRAGAIHSSDVIVLVND